MLNSATPRPDGWAATRYPAPDYTARGVVALVVPVARDPRDGGVGWLVRQGDALGWLPVARPDEAGHALGRFVDDLLAAAARQGRPAAREWEHLLTLLPHEAPQERDLGGLLDEVRRARAATATPRHPLMPWMPLRRPR